MRRRPLKGRPAFADPRFVSELCLRPPHAFFPRLSTEFSPDAEFHSAQGQGRARITDIFEDVTNPFCGTLPDDLVVERTDQGLKVLKNGCGKSIAGFERELPPSSPKVAGKEVDLAKAIKEAGKLIGKAAQPLYGGLATDVEGMRAVLALAERSGGIVDHALSEAQYRNFKILQSSGWIMSTLTSNT